MNVLRFFAIVGVVLAGGCSVIVPEKADTELRIESAVADKESVVTGKEVVTAIEPDVLYMLLVAELAGQRKQYDIAMEGYLRAAKRVDDVRLSARAAKIALYLKDSQRTGDAVSLWLSQEPDNLDARKIALLSALREEDKVASLEHMSFLIEADPAGFEKTLFELAKMMQREEKGDFVYEVLDDLAGQHQDQAVVPFVQAVLAVQMGKNFVAGAKVEEALVIQPEWSKALLFQAQLATLSSKPEDAQKVIEAALEKDPDNIQLKKLLANVLIKSGELNQAVDVFQEILADNPDDKDTQYALALVYLQLQQFASARDLFEKLSISAQYQTQANMYLGKLEVKQGNINKGLVWFDRVTDEGQKFKALVASLSALIDVQQYDRALTRLQDKRDNYPEQAVRLVLIEAEIHNGKKHYQQAFAVLSQGLLEHPGQKDLLYTRSLVAERLDRLDVVEADLNEILRQNPNDSNALNALGYTFADRTNRFEEAEGYLQRALELQPDEPVIIDSYGWLLYRQGKPEQALEYLQKAYKEVKESEIAAHLIEVLWVLGKEHKAREIYQQAMDISDNKEPLQELLKRYPALQ